MLKSRYGSMTKGELLAKKEARKAKIGGEVKYLTLLINFLHQGFFYLDPTEKIMRVLLEIIPIVLLMYAFSFVFPGNMAGIVLNFLASLFCVHFLNWVFNHNFVACLLGSIPSRRNKGVDETVVYLNSLHRRLARRSSITAIMYLGSLCRFQWNNRSDIDMRILRKKGTVNGLCAYFLVLGERIRALIAGQPLDLYLADSPEFLRAHREDEIPSFAFKRDERIKAEDFDGPVVFTLDIRTFNKHLS